MKKGWKRAALAAAAAGLSLALAGCSLPMTGFADYDVSGYFQALLDSFRYDDPRAETCCALGAWFQTREDWRRAVFWYELALTRERNDEGGGFVQPDCYGFLPCIQLCVCWDRLGRRDEAEAWNQRAGSYKPEDPSYLWNLAYFASLS